MFNCSNSSEAIKLFCEENNLTPYKFAKYTNISITYAYNIINGKMKNPSAWIIDRINRGIESNARLIEIERNRGKNNEHIKRRI